MRLEVRTRDLPAGAGHDEGGLLDRLDGAALGAATGGAAGAVMAGAGVLVARGVARTRIWGRFARRRFVPNAEMHVSDAHSINFIGPRTRFGGGNRNTPKAIAYGDVDLAVDLAEINAGRAELLDTGDILTSSGRIYGTHGTGGSGVFPRRGPGLVDVTQAEFDILRTMSTSGGMTGNAERALNGMLRSGNGGVTAGTRNKLIRLFDSRIGR